MRAVFATAFRSRPLAAWTDVFAATDACVTPVLTLAEFETSEHARARHSILHGAEGPEPGLAARVNYVRPACPRLVPNAPSAVL